MTTAHSSSNPALQRSLPLGLALALSLLAAGCAPTAPAPARQAGDSPASATSEVVEGPALDLQPHHVRTGRVLREPMLVEHPSGVWFVTGYGSQDPRRSSPEQPPSLWRSDDRGATWSAVDVGSRSDGAYGNSDVDLSLGPEGNLYLVAMGFDRTTFRGTHVTAGTSKDAGQTWNWTVLSETEFDDRPWIRATPDGRVHAIWNDGAGVAYSRSDDGGSTWTEQPRIHGSGGSSHLAVGPAGQLAARIGPMSASGNRSDPGEDWIAVSPGGGDRWALRPPPGDGTWPQSIAELGIHPRWVDPLAWNAKGDLLHAWTSNRGLQIARSSDGGATWTTWRIAPSPENGALFFPYLTGGFDVSRRSSATDRYAITWFERSGSDLAARIARLTFEGSTLHVERTPPLRLPLQRRGEGDDGASTPDTGGEYFPAILSQDGTVVAATPIQDDPDGDGFTIWSESPK